MCSYVLGHTCADIQRVEVSISSCYPPHFLRKGLSLSWSPLVELCWVATKPMASNLGSSQCLIIFSFSFEGLKLDLHVYIGSILKENKTNFTKRIWESPHPSPLGYCCTPEPQQYTKHDPGSLCSSKHQMLVLFLPCFTPAQIKFK